MMVYFFYLFSLSLPASMGLLDLSPAKQRIIRHKLGLSDYFSAAGKVRA